MTPPLWQYVVVHRSCAALPGVLACQVAHAVGEAVNGQVPDDTLVCALVAEKAADLEALAGVLGLAEIGHALIREPDPPYNGSAVALATEPVERDRVRALMGAFKVLR